MLISTSPTLRDVITFPMSTSLCSFLPGIVSLLRLTITCIQAVTSHTYRQGRFDKHTMDNLYRIMVMETSVVGMMKMGNIVHRAGIKPTYLASWASVLITTPPRLPDVKFVPTVYVASCLSG